MRSKKNVPKMSMVPIDAIEFAIERLEEYIDFRESNDIDDLDSSKPGDDKWSKFYEWFYAACQ